MTPSVLVTDRSALAMTFVGSMAESLAATGSLVVVSPVTVLDRVVPSGTAAPTATTSVKLAEAPAASVERWQSTVPPEPTDGTRQVKVGPLSWVRETKVVPAGSGSDRVTDWASDGPPFAIVIV